MQHLIWIARIIAVVALLCVAAAIATPPGRLPLAIRGLQRMLRRDRGVNASADDDRPVSLPRRLAAFVLVLLAAALCLFP